MKKLSILAIFAIFALILVACSSQTTEANVEAKKVETVDDSSFTPASIVAFMASKDPNEPMSFYFEGDKAFVTLYNGTSREMNEEEYFKLAYPLAEEYAQYRATEEYEATGKSQDLISTVFAYVYGYAFEFTVKNGEEILDYHIIEKDDDLNIFYEMTKPMPYQDYIQYLVNSAIEIVRESKLSAPLIKVNVNEYSFYLHYDNGEVTKIEYTDNIH